MSNFMHDVKLSLAFAAILVVLGTCIDKAMAQVPVQPSYTRPSKGTATQWYSASQNAGSATTTQLYDWSAFYSLSIFTTFSKADGTACACPSVFNPSTGQTRAQCQFSWTKFNIKGSSDKTGNFFTAFSIDGTGRPLFGTAASDGFLTGGVNIQATYIKGEFQTGTYVDYAGNPIATPCFMKVVVQPLPFPYRYESVGAPTTFDPVTQRMDPPPVVVGGISWWDEQEVKPLNIDQSSGALAVREHYKPKLSNDGATTVVQFEKACLSNSDCSATGAARCVASKCTVTMVAEAVGYPYSGVRLQNVGTLPAVCAAGVNASLLNPTVGAKYSFILKAESVAGDGTGGVLDIPTLYAPNTDDRKVYCTVTGVGTTTIAVLPH